MNIYILSHAYVIYRRVNVSVISDTLLVAFSCCFKSCRLNSTHVCYQHTKRTLPSVCIHNSSFKTRLKNHLFQSNPAVTLNISIVEGGFNTRHVSGADYASIFR